MKEQQRLEDLYSWLKTSRQPFEMAIEDIQALMLPHRLEIMTSTREGKQRIPASYDSTAANAADALVNFLVGAVFPASADWLKFDLFLSEPSDEERDLLDFGTEKIMQVLDNSNFYEAAAVSLKDFWVLGNTTWYQEEQTPSAMNSLFGSEGGFTGLAFEGVQFSNMFRHLDRQGMIVAACRRFSLTMIEAQQFFQEEWSIKWTDPSEEVEVLHFYELEMDRTYKESWYVPDYGVVIRSRSGLLYCPYVCSRLDQVGNEQYGVGRGHIARPTAAGMNEMRRQLLNATGRSLNTPLVVENESVVRTERGTGGLLVMREAAAFQPFYLRADVDLPAVDNIFRADSLQVERAFMSDILLDPASQPRSAEESRLRQSRLQSRIAGPTQGVRRWLSAVIGNVVMAMIEAGALEEFEQLQAVQPVFSSPFFVAQRQGSIQKVLDFVQLKTTLAQAAQDPSILDDIDFDGLSRYIRRNADVPGELFKPDEVVQEQRGARAEQEGLERGMQQAAMMQQAMPPMPAEAQAPEGTIPVEGAI